MYRQETIKETIKDIVGNQMYLPAIQRNFVWSVDQISNLFDSIMQGYPIGTFLYWKVSNQIMNEIVFYQFISDFHPLTTVNQRVQTPIVQNDIIGVLDGQQRLSSLYIALQGFYHHTRYGRNNPQNYQRKELYLDLLYERAPGDDMMYKFIFLTNEEFVRETLNSRLLLKVKDVMRWDKAAPYPNDIIDENRDQMDQLGYPLNNVINNLATRSADHDRVAMALTLIRQRIFTDNTVNYFESDSPNIDDVLNIFVRVNSGGTVLCKSDLLFSTIVAQWLGARDSFEELTSRVTDYGFKIDNDFIVRSCLFLLDLNITLSVGGLMRDNNVNRIKNNWESIKNSILETFKNLAAWGYSDERISSYNAIVPLIYFPYKGGELCEIEVNKYIFSATINRAFRSSSNTVLASIRSSFQQEYDGVQNPSFNFSDLASLNAKFNITKDHISDALDSKKGVAGFNVLALFYPNLNYQQTRFHQDHIHPESRFRRDTYRQLGLTPGQIQDYIQKKDLVPNLQLLEGALNQQKQAAPFDQWLMNTFNGDNRRDQFKTNHYIPQDVDLDFANFLVFFEARKKLMAEKLYNLFNIQDQDQLNNAGQQ